MKPISNGNVFIKYSSIIIIAFLYSILLFSIPRTNFTGTYSIFLALFAFYFYVIKKIELFSLNTCLILALILRIIALFNTPALSDDYFRFIWDGQMFINHVSPFAFTPDDYIKLHPGPYLQALHDNMNSSEYYSVYPAMLQYLFAAAAKASPGNTFGALMVLKFLILCAELVTALLLYKYCRLKEIDVRNILWYLLNPLVIVELTGNVHFEAFLILGLVGTFYYLEKNKLWAAALFWALAICSKFLPLMMAPLILMYLGFKRFFVFGLIASMAIIIMFLPFIDHSLLNIQYSVSKFYDLFEFNAACYYFIKWILAFFTDHDFSDLIAKILGYLCFCMILFISFYKFKKDQLLERALFILFIYFLTTTMVHPWYVTTLVIFSVFTKFKFPVTFSILIPLSYFPYSLATFNENYILIFVEYALVLAWLMWEIRNRKIEVGKI